MTVADKDTPDVVPWWNTFIRVSEVISDFQSTELVQRLPPLFADF